MKLLLVIKSLNSEGGGAERVLVELANGMLARGHLVGVLTFDPPGGTSFYYLREEIIRVDLGIGASGASLPKFGLLFALPRLRKFVLASNADLVIGFMHSSYVPLIASLLGTGTRIVASEHTNAPHFATRPAQRLLTKLASKMVLAKIVPTAAIKREYAAKEARKIRVLANPINLSRLNRVVTTKSTKSRRIVCIGRLSEEKGQATLVEAFAKLATEFPDWELRIVGDGPQRCAVDALVRALKLQDRVTLTGFVHDVATEYVTADLVVVPSRYEAFGLVTAEALAAGCPVIGFADCVGTAALIGDNHNGLLVQGGECRSTNLSMAMARAMKSSKLRDQLSKAGPKSVRHLDLDTILNEWEAFILSLQNNDNREYAE